MLAALQLNMLLAPAIPRPVRPTSTTHGGGVSAEDTVDILYGGEVQPIIRRLYDFPPMTVRFTIETERRYLKVAGTSVAQEKTTEAVVTLGIMTLTAFASYGICSVILGKRR